MNDNNALVTKEFLRDTLRETFSEFGDRFAVLINKSFQGMEVRMARMESQMAKQEDLLALTARVGKIEQRLDGHDREFKDIHKNFDIVFAELKDIRK